MATGYEVQMYRHIERIAIALERIAAALTPRLPAPPADLAEAWRDYKAGAELPEDIVRSLDEWRADCAREAGF